MTVAAWILLSASGPAPASEATPWDMGAHSKARLIDGGAMPAETGRRLAGLEIRLDPAFITYWRDPGDAGVAPTFEFAGSTNLKAADVRYPAPERLDEAGAAAFGYAGDVTFPIVLTPVDPGAPIGLRLTLAYAACRDICLPVHAALSIALDAHPSAEVSRITEALAAVPRPARLGERTDRLAILRATPGPAGDLRVDAAGPSGSTLFVEAPDAFDFEAGAATPAADGGLTFPVKRVDGPAGAPTPPLTLTLVAPGDPRRAIEVHLDAGAKTP